MKYFIIILCALAGVGYGFLFSDHFFPTVMGVLLGFILGYVYAVYYISKHSHLQIAFTKLGNVRGKTLNEIVAVAGPYKAVRNCSITDKDNAPGYLYVWNDKLYYIILLFDKDNVCLGISMETGK